MKITTEALRMELGRTNIGVSLILKGIGRNKAKILVGSDCGMMDFLYRLMPQQAGRIIIKVMSANHGGIFNTPGDMKMIRISWNVLAFHEVLRPARSPFFRAAGFVRLR